MCGIDKRRSQGLPPRSDEPFARNPLLWQTTARTHIHSANVLFRDYDKRYREENQKLLLDPLKYYVICSVNTVLLLYGLAIENLVKAVIIARNEPPFVNGHLNRKLDTHDLKNLCDQANLNYTRTNEDNQLLDALSEVIESGKYPISKKFPVPLYVRHPILEQNPPHKGYHKIRQHALRLLTLLERELRDSSSNSTLETETDLATL